MKRQPDDLALQAAVSPPSNRRGDSLSEDVVDSGVEPRIGKVDWETANWVDEGPPPFICGNCRFIVFGQDRDKMDLCMIVDGPFNGGIEPDDSCRFFAHKPDPRIPHGGPNLVVLAGHEEPHDSATDGD